MQDILLVTLTMDDASFAHFDALRRQYFPPERNKIPAHITLFHALPGAERAAVTAQLQTIAQRQERFVMTTNGLMFLGFGTAYTLDAPQAIAIHSALQTQWHDWLKPQDRDRKLKPHITVQNKAAPESARQLHAELQRDFAPQHVTAAGFDLWRYLQGPWEHLQFIPFKT